MDVTRRGFLKVLGASTAVGTLADPGLGLAFPLPERIKEGKETTTICPYCGMDHRHHEQGQGSKCGRRPRSPNQPRGPLLERRSSEQDSREPLPPDTRPLPSPGICSVGSQALELGRPGDRKTSDRHPGSHIPGKGRRRITARKKACI